MFSSFHSGSHSDCALLGCDTALYCGWVSGLSRTCCEHLQSSNMPLRKVSFAYNTTRCHRPEGQSVDRFKNSFLSVVLLFFLFSVALFSLVCFSFFCSISVSDFLMIFLYSLFLSFLCSTPFTPSLCYPSEFEHADG
jgi:hypothetical protein